MARETAKKGVTGDPPKKLFLSVTALPSLWDPPYFGVIERSYNFLFFLLHPLWPVSWRVTEMGGLLGALIWVVLHLISEVTDYPLIWIWSFFKFNSLMTFAFIYNSFFFFSLFFFQCLFGISDEGDWAQGSQRWPRQEVRDSEGRARTR